MARGQEVSLSRAAGGDSTCVHDEEAVTSGSVQAWPAMLQEA